MVHGRPEAPEGTLRDLLTRDKARKMTLVTTVPGKDAREAILDYRILHSADGMSRVRILLRTGRTHQIRVQFASRGWPLVGERKYAIQDDPCELALFSQHIGFLHPRTGCPMEFHHEPPEEYPWNQFCSCANRSSKAERKA